MRLGSPNHVTQAADITEESSSESHYSYECKASSQERPYVSRPSRSQQFRNPKLVPKLTNDTLNPLEKKQGVADEQLAKAEAERARKREREERDDELIESAAKRPRSVSSHSVSTISTGASRSPSPARERTRSPPPARRSRIPYSDEDAGLRGGRRDDSRSRSRSLSRSRSRSPRVEYQHRRSVSRDSRSPEDDRRDRYRSREPIPPREDNGHSRRQRRYSSESRGSYESRHQHPRESRSPEHRGRRFERPDRRDTRPGRERHPRGGHNGRGHGRRGPPPNEQPRERSLSPFSRRLAMTQAMNMGGR
ncbi:hypothetical protein MRS44_007776 [Fusarium solani]|uniref:uncharacterized protein n=1 Tax=Fusarium solani TaxID=169388 RepID=UPI0032C3DEF8|nr:hypothetical protein MRS44_007776 [Fusarium solani]